VTDFLSDWDDERDRAADERMSRVKPNVVPDPIFDVPVGYFVLYGGRWQVGFWGQMPQGRIVQVYSKARQQWLKVILATQSTATIRYKGNNIVHLYGFTIKNNLR